MRGFQQGGAMLIYSDSSSATKLANNPDYHEKTKHVAVDWYFINEKIEKQDVLLVQVPTKDQLADFLTKAINKTKL